MALVLWSWAACGQTPWHRPISYAGLARPEAQLTARRNECRTTLRAFKRDAPVVAAVQHSRLAEERQGGIYIANEFTMGEGIGDEIPRCSFAGQALCSFF